MLHTKARERIAGWIRLAKKMNHALTRNNHYVPVWYQKGFLTSNESQLYYLDKAAHESGQSDGRDNQPGGRLRPPVSKLPPKKCFCTLDLYTTQSGSALNDDIERYLFGKLDGSGSNAVRAFVSGDPVGMHEGFQDFFEYLDAQKLRTPKGLDWIRTCYPSLTQVDLMHEMQALRLMHCTMWTEGVREIVSAEQSDVKFIVSDHPVAIYNRAVQPTSEAGTSSIDPPVDLVGSQTVFALDANTCLILSHLEYANNPQTADLTRRRTNARYRGGGLVRTDAFIRKRKLNRGEVIKINQLLKTGSRRYVAAGKREWLYPEKDSSGTWADIAEVLLPRDELWQFGGEIYAKFDDGHVHYQDAFGRQSGAHKYLAKKLPSGKVGVNDPCGCGSGRKFKHCCKDLPASDRPAWDIFGIRERNLLLCRAVTDILGLDSGKTWDDVRRELSDEQIVNIHEAFGSLWPTDTNLPDLLPRPSTNLFRAVYLGTIDPRTIAPVATGWLAYFDQIVVAHPFVNPVGMRPEFSPTHSPSQYKEQTLKNVLALLMLEPFIDAGYVHLVPTPMDFDIEFSKIVMKMARTRTANWKPDKASTDQFMELAREDLMRTLSRLPDDRLRKLVKSAIPDASDEAIEALISATRSQYSGDPLTLLQPLLAGENGGQLKIVKGYGLEAALYLAALTGSEIYTDVHSHWDHLHEHTSAARSDNAAPDWKPIADAFSSLTLPIDLDLQASFTARQTGKFNDMREAIRRIGNLARDESNAVDKEKLARVVLGAAEKNTNQWQGSNLAHAAKGRVDISVPQSGFERNEITRLLITFGSRQPIRPPQMALFIRTTY
ncbi:hypothetical protein CF70_031110 [Cupriavidus sp. SK-3]|uniref:DUF4238 domain-containing protein n=1 Tax=Cupriavidus sp. SK-3 TaxID=1470558 RepID=UPI00044D6993|nr:DUF4238 domain-containing protein [Cupriavidus sp. SK-3]KDP89453.1 hypothetical protein CF70_031110 [Cupriavidus sp. SK-3]